MEIVLFEVRTRDGIDVAEYERTFVRMVELAHTVPGFLGIEGYASGSGTEMAVARFETPEAVRQWRDHPEHVEVRRRGREEFFAGYDITVASVSRHYDWVRPLPSANATAG